MIDPWKMENGSKYFAWYEDRGRCSLQLQSFCTFTHFLVTFDLAVVPRFIGCKENGEKTLFRSKHVKLLRVLASWPNENLPSASYTCCRVRSMSTTCRFSSAASNTASDDCVVYLLRQKTLGHIPAASNASIPLANPASTTKNVENILFRKSRRTN